MPTFPSLTPSNRRQRRLLFFISAVLMLLAGISVIELLATAWGAWGLSRNALRGAMNAVGLPATVFYYLPLGVFVGLVGGLLLDSYKYFQGVIVAGATLLAVPAIFLPRGVFIDPLATTFGPNTVLTALIAAGVTLRAGGVTFESLQTDPREYPRIPALIFWLTVALVALGLFEAHVAYQSPVLAVSDGYVLQPFAFEGFVGTAAAQHIVGAAILLPALRYFTTYERGLNVIMIGPKRSGKSAVFGGLHLYIRDNVDQGGEAATRVSTLRRDIESGRFPEATPATLQRGGGGDAGSSQPMLLELPYSWGRFLPARVKFSAVDYPGEALESILENVVAAARRRTQGETGTLVSDGGERESSGFDIPFSDSDDDGDDDGTRGADSADESAPGASSGDETAPDASADEDTVEWDTSFGSDAGSSSSTGGSATRGGDTGSAPDEGDGSPFGSESKATRARRGSASSGTGGLGDRAGASGSAGGGLFDQSGDDADETAELDPKASWETATAVVREATNIDQMIPGIRGCVHNADRIVLTLPLDDFVAPVIERGNVPSYLRDRVIAPEELDEYRRSEIRPIEYQGRTYAIKGPDREPLENYLFWYESLRSVYPEKDIVIVGTMADWMLEDFRANHSTNDAPQADAYEDFCAYVRDEIVREQSPAINQVFGGRDPDPLHLLWYNIENEEPAGTDELRIDVSGPASVLKGARQFMERINE
ncbi:hypothetical protein [Halobellus sp. GM3]|uniref:hypothetical protein n=1 Tax=Halobellus sp. GM3 TaxID=3458410 RepID=UPI00403D92CE